jgi:hypothetical protein
MKKYFKIIHPVSTGIFFLLAAYFFVSSRGLKLADYDPVSTIRVDEHEVLRAKFPVIDVHTHLGQFKRTFPEECAEKAIRLMDTCNIKMLVDMDGKWINLSRESVDAYQRNYPGRFLHFVHFNSFVPDILQMNDFGDQVMSRIEESYGKGARGIKVWKNLGTPLYPYFKEEEGKLLPINTPFFDRLNNYVEKKIPSLSRKVIPIDDPRFDPVWFKAGELNIPVLMHTGDPAAFFQPVNRHNERYEQMVTMPDWNFSSPGFPSYESLMNQRDNVLKKHPNTIFIGAHLGMMAEDLESLGRTLDKYGNYYVDIAATLPIIGRQPYTAREFFIKYQDQILFGSDYFGEGVDPEPEHYGFYFRFLETFDEYFEYPLRDLVNQGRWRIYGIGLPDEVLEKIYYQNAERIFFGGEPRRSRERQDESPDGKPM